MPLFDGGTCALASLTVMLSSATVGWTESGTLELHHAEGCRELRLLIPDGVELTEIGGRVRAMEDGSFRLPPERFARIVSNGTGARIVKLWLDDLDPGDVLSVTWERRWTRAEDYVLDPGAISFVEVKLPRGARHSHAGFRDDGRWVFTEGSDTRWLRVSHPWAERDAPLIPRTTEQGLSAAEALERMRALLPVPRAADGRQPVLGDAALTRGAVDDRGFARTLVALTHGGPDEVALARWSHDAQTDPAPGAPEAVAVRRDGGVELLTHPGIGMPAGVAHTPWGTQDSEVQATTSPTWEDPRWTMHVDIELPKRPVLALTPAGGARVRTTATARWEAADIPRYAFVPLPLGVDATLGEVVGDGHVRTTGDGAWILLAPGTTTAAITWYSDMQDVWGVLPWAPDAPPTSRVVRLDGRVDPGDRMVWDDDRTWHLTRLDNRELITSDARLGYELATRVAAASYPEPAASQQVRGARVGWDLAEVLPDILASRAAVVALPTRPPLLPRPLHKTRKTRMLTPFEAAATLMLYLRQGRLRADWGLAQPRGSEAVGPARWTDAVVRLTHDGETRWMAPGCTTCDLWTLPDALLGVPVLMAEGVVTTPHPMPEPVMDSPAPVADDPALAVPAPEMDPAAPEGPSD